MKKISFEVVLCEDCVKQICVTVRKIDSLFLQPLPPLKNNVTESLDKVEKFLPDILEEKYYFKCMFCDREFNPGNPDIFRNLFRT